MALKFLALARALIAVLLDRPLRVRLRGGVAANLYPREGLVLPVMAGAAPEGDEGGDGDGDGGDGDGNEGDGDGSSDDGDGEGEGSEGDGEKKDWRKELRRYERTTERKRERDKKELKEAQDKLKEIEDEKKSDDEKAIEKAKEEGRNEALTEAQKERRKDRLESAVTRAAARKITIGEGEGKKEVRFDDPEDAELYIERAIKNGDLDEDDLFDDSGKVKADLLAESLKEILEEKPRLAEEVGGGAAGRTADGEADQGRGSGDGSKVDMNDLLRRG
jgi:hypothetical protein